MNLVLTVLEVVAPVFALAAIGVAWVRLGFEFHLEFVTRLTMTLAVPVLIFHALMTSEVAPEALATVSLAALAAYALIAVAALVALLAVRLDIRTYLAPIVFGNTGNIGLPLTYFAFGETGLDHGVVVLAVTSILSFTLGIWVVSGGGSPFRILREPMVAATVLGAVFLGMGWETPQVVTATLALIGQMAIPLMLITLGVAVARLSPRRLGRSAWLALLKAVLAVTAGCAAGWWFDLPPTAFAIVVLQMATPVAVTSYLLAQKYGADADAVAGLVLVSTLGAVIVLPVLLGFLM